MNPFNPTLGTPSGVWNPLVWLLVFLIALIIALAVYLLGERSRNRGMQEGIFLSGHEDPGDARAHIPGSNIGWGFMEGMKKYYAAMRAIHTGMVNDYVGWFLGILATMLIVFLLWGGAP